MNQKLVSICSDLTALIANTVTLKQLGLTVYLYHTYGSKKLIEDLCYYGHTLLYTEIRHFSGISCCTPHKQTTKDTIWCSGTNQCSAQSEEGLAFSRGSTDTGVSHSIVIQFCQLSIQILTNYLASFFENFIDLFCMSSPLSQLINIATGVEASQEVHSSLLQWHDAGGQEDFH